jgi:hypothetical protein
VTRLEANDGSEVDHRNQAKIPTTRHKNAPEEAMLNGHLRHLIVATLISSKVVAVAEVEVQELVDANKSTTQGA